MPNFGCSNNCCKSLARRRLKGIHSRSDTNRTGAEGLSFYYPRLLHCRNQMLAVVLLSQHRVSSSKTVRPRAPCGARCIGHAVSTWSAVCSEAPHSRFDEGARPHLCMDEWNRPTPVHRWLSLTQAARDKPNPTGLAPVSGTKHGAWKYFHSTPFSIFDLYFLCCISKAFLYFLYCISKEKGEIFFYILNVKTTPYTRFIVVLYVCRLLFQISL